MAIFSILSKMFSIASSLLPTDIFNTVFSIQLSNECDTKGLMKSSKELITKCFIFVKCVIHTGLRSITISVSANLILICSMVIILSTFNICKALPICLGSISTPPTIDSRVSLLIPTMVLSFETKPSIGANITVGSVLESIKNCKARSPLKLPKVTSK